MNCIKNSPVGKPLVLVIARSRTSALPLRQAYGGDANVNNAAEEEGVNIKSNVEPTLGNPRSTLSTGLSRDGDSLETAARTGVGDEGQGRKSMNSTFVPTAEAVSQPGPTMSFAGKTPAMTSMIAQLDKQLSSSVNGRAPTALRGHTNDVVPPSSSASTVSTTPSSSSHATPSYISPNPAAALRVSPQSAVVQAWTVSPISSVQGGATTPAAAIGTSSGVRQPNESPVITVRGRAPPEPPVRSDSLGKRPTALGPGHTSSPSAAINGGTANEAVTPAIHTPAKLAFVAQSHGTASQVLSSSKAGVRSPAIANVTPASSVGSSAIASPYSPSTFESIPSPIPVYHMKGGPNGPTQAPDTHEFRKNETRISLAELASIRLGDIHDSTKR